jgi:hypothetical protein
MPSKGVLVAMYHQNSEKKKNHLSSTLAEERKKRMQRM